MAHDTRCYDAVTQTMAIQQLFHDIRRDIATAESRRELTALSQRTRYLTTLTHAQAWVDMFGMAVVALRAVAQEEFATTARQINHRATSLGLPADYAEQWEQSA